MIFVIEIIVVAHLLKSAYSSVKFTNIPRQLTKEMAGDDRIAYVRLLSSMSSLKKHTNRKQPRNFVVTFLHSGEVEM